MARQISWRGALSPNRPGDGRSEAQRLWRPGSPVVPPQSIVDSVRLMQFGAFLEVAEIIRGLLTRGQLREAIAHEATAGRLVATDADIEGVLRVTLSVTTVTAALSCAIWLVMARATARGSRWGRIIACVLFALSLGIFFGGLLPTAGLFARTFAVALLLIEAWTLVRLWHRDSSAWIKYQTIPQE